MSEVKCTGTHPVDLSDGRPLAPGERATGITLDAHNQALVDDGHLTVVQHPPEEPARGKRPTPTVPASADDEQ